MRKIIGICLLFITLLANAQTKSYTINGTIEAVEYNGKYIYLQKMSEDRRTLVKIDSALIENNKFVFNKSLTSNDPQLTFVSFPKVQNAPQSLVILENGIIDLKMGTPSQVSGTPENEKLYRFIQDQDALKNRMRSLFQNEEYAETQQGMTDYEAILDTIKSMAKTYIKANINNEVGEFFLFSFSQLLEPSEIVSLISESRPEFKNSAQGKEMTAFFEKKAKTGKSAKFMDFTLPTPEGKQIALSDYAGKGKIVLVDFWASWCGPCIKEMPNVVTAYNQYKDKGFEIVGVSFDTDANAWKNALARLNMTWPQMSDLKGWKSEAGQLYGISSIPFTMLLDKDGTIIATNLRGNLLINKLKELLD